MKLKAFFEQNTWASVLVLVLVVVAVGVVMYYRIKNAQEELERRNPAINVYGNKFGKKKDGWRPCFYSSALSLSVG